MTDTKDTPGPCSCKIVHTVTDAYVHAMSEYPNRIEFCPLHKAALELLEALKELEALRKTPHPSGDLNAAVAYRQRERDAVVLSKAAIAKAEGKPDEAV